MDDIGKLYFEHETERKQAMEYRTWRILKTFDTTRIDLVNYSKNIADTWVKLATNKRPDLNVHVLIAQIPILLKVQLLPVRRHYVLGLTRRVHSLFTDLGLYWHVFFHEVIEPHIELVEKCVVECFDQNKCENLIKLIAISLLANTLTP